MSSTRPPETKARRRMTREQIRAKRASELLDVISSYEDQLPSRFGGNQSYISGPSRSKRSIPKRKSSGANLQRMQRLRESETESFSSAVTTGTNTEFEESMSAPNVQRKGSVASSVGSVGQQEPQSSLLNYGWIFPIIPTVLDYNKPDFLADLKAAASIAFVLIPQAIAFSTLAGVTPIRALVSAVFPLIFYAIFGASRQLSVGPEALSSVLVGLAVSKEIEEFGGDPNKLAALLGMIVGAFAILLAVIRAGFIDNIMSGYLLTGFVLGVANLIMVEQLPGMFGLVLPASEEKRSTFKTATRTFSAFGTVKPNAAILGVMCLLFLLSFKFIKKRYGHSNQWVSQIPEILVLVLLSTIFSIAMDFKKNGIPTLGAFDNTLPSPDLPLPSSFEQIFRLLPNAVIITIVGFIESQTVTRSFGLKNGYFPSGDRELFALGASNVLGSVFGAYVTFGSLPRSRILANSGGRTTISGAMAAMIVLILTTTLASVLKFLPKPTLSAIVMNAAINLIEYEEIYFVFCMRDPLEIFMFLATWALTIFVSIDDAIIFCIGMSALFILRKTTTVKLGLMGKKDYNVTEGGRSVEKTQFVDIRDNADAQLVPGLLVLAIQSSLEFYNAAQLRRRIDILIEIEREQLEDDIDMTPAGNENMDMKRQSTFFVNSKIDYSAGDGLVIIIDFSRCEYMDSNAAHTLKKICKNFKKEGVTVMLSGLNEQLAEILERSHVYHEVGESNIFQTVSEAYTAKQSFARYQKTAATADYKVNLGMH